MMGRLLVILLGLAVIAVASGNWLQELRADNWRFHKRNSGKTTGDATPPPPPPTIWSCYSNFSLDIYR